MSYHTTDIPNARAARISDDAVEQLGVIGKMLEAGHPIDATSVELLRITFGGVCRELIQRRRAMGRMGLDGPNDFIRLIDAAAA